MGANSTAIPTRPLGTAQAQACDSANIAPYSNARNLPQTIAGHVTSILQHRDRAFGEGIFCGMRCIGVVLCCVAAVYVAATSTSKADVYLNGCGSNQPLFPLDQTHPSSWKSCNDAYEYTWLSDFDGYLRGMSLTNRIRLAYSMVSAVLLLNCVEVSRPEK